ncbi:hypothetical protein CAPTEDRAFT_208851 [Capitella teleta]|uniref:Murine leukemia virus integrase C-terminal domain-containing protein n=1 Tax=Capitella teleta TaxID=283909 RepID=R7VF67_CAPTE|nr:hypothetical protein CAPTEDRAFT_208851 [Capitella teleta]|eukprot:ELU17254.1 hypothetical protein CAPTEDRAFT_208851 [Capitella teleta]
MVSATRITPYLASFGVRPRVPKCLTPSAPMEERLHNLYVAHKFLTEYHKTQTAKYKEKKPVEARALQPGVFVSVRNRNPSKGEPKWQPGYQVFSSRGPALRIRQLETHREYRLNRKDVWVIPAATPYDEIDPLPPKKRRVKETDLPIMTSPLALPTEPTVLTPPGTRAIKLYHLIKTSRATRIAKCQRMHGGSEEKNELFREMKEERGKIEEERASVERERRQWKMEQTILEEKMVQVQEERRQ